MGFLSKLYESVRVNSKLVDHVNDDDIYNVSNRSVGPVQHVRVNSTIVDHPNDNEIYNASTQTIGSGNETVTADEATINTLLRLPEASATISSGSISYSAPTMALSGEGNAADDLDNITGGSAGDLLILRKGSNDITVRNAQGGAGEIYLDGSANKALNNVVDRLFLQRDFNADRWAQIAFSNNS